MRLKMTVASMCCGSGDRDVYHALNIHQVNHLAQKK